jgi:hypothetical protein
MYRMLRLHHLIHYRLQIHLPDPHLRRRQNQVWVRTIK